MTKYFAVSTLLIPVTAEEYERVKELSDAEYNELILAKAKEHQLIRLNHEVIEAAPKGQ